MPLTIEGKGWNFNAITRHLATQRGLIKRNAGRMAVNHFKEGFRNQGFTDTTLNPWEEVKRRQQGTNAYKYAKKSSRTRGILIESGDLRQAVKVLAMPGERVIIGTRGLRYAAIHNDGLRGRAFGKYGFKMPRRRFIGNSKVLEARTRLAIIKSINKIWAQS